MGEVKTETVRKLSPESVTLINEIWELLGHLKGENPTPEQMREATGGKDEYQLRKLALQLRDKWRKPSKSSQTQTAEADYKEGGEGTSL